MAIEYLIPSCYIGFNKNVGIYFKIHVMLTGSEFQLTLPVLKRTMCVWCYKVSRVKCVESTVPRTSVAFPMHCFWSHAWLQQRPIGWWHAWLQERPAGEATCTRLSLNALQAFCYGWLHTNTWLLLELSVTYFCGW